MAEILEARVKQKTGTEADFAGFTLLDGEIALVKETPGGPVTNFKVGPGLFDSLPYSLDFADLIVKGIAEPSTDPNPADTGDSYFAGVGTFTNFLDAASQPITTTENFNVLTYNGSSWDVLPVPINVDLSGYATKADLHTKADNSEFLPIKNKVDQAFAYGTTEVALPPQDTVDGLDTVVYGASASIKGFGFPVGIRQNFKKISVPVFVVSGTATQARIVVKEVDSNGSILLDETFSGSWSGQTSIEVEFDLIKNESESRLYVEIFVNTNIGIRRTGPTAQIYTEEAGYPKVGFTTVDDLGASGLSYPETIHSDYQAFFYPYEFEIVATDRLKEIIDEEIADTPVDLPPSVITASEITNLIFEEDTKRSEVVTTGDLSVALYGASANIYGWGFPVGVHQNFDKIEIDVVMAPATDWRIVVKENDSSGAVLVDETFSGNFGGSGRTTLTATFDTVSNSSASPIWVEFYANQTSAIYRTGPTAQIYTEAAGYPKVQFTTVDDLGASGFTTTSVNLDIYSVITGDQFSARVTDAGKEILSSALSSSASDFVLPDANLKFSITGSSVTWGDGYLQSGYVKSVIENIQSGVATSVLASQFSDAGDLLTNRKYFKGSAVRLEGIGTEIAFDISGNEVSIVQAIERSNVNASEIEVYIDGVLHDTINNFNPSEIGSDTKNFVGDGTSVMFDLNRPFTYGHTATLGGSPLVVTMNTTQGTGFTIPPSSDCAIIRRLGQDENGNPAVTHWIWFKVAPANGQPIVVNFDYGEELNYEKSTIGKNAAGNNECPYGDGDTSFDPLAPSSIATGLDFRETDSRVITTYRFLENKTRNVKLKIKGLYPGATGTPYFIFNFATNRIFYFQNAGIGGWDLWDLDKTLNNEYLRGWQRVVQFNPDVLLIETTPNDDWIVKGHKVYTTNNVTLAELRTIKNLPLRSITYQSGDDTYDISRWVGVITAITETSVTFSGTVDTPIEAGDVVKIGQYFSNNNDYIERVIASVSGNTLNFDKPIGKDEIIYDDLQDFVGKEIVIRTLDAFETKLNGVIDHIKASLGACRIGILENPMPNVLGRELWGYPIIMDKVAKDKNVVSVNYDSLREWQLSQKKTSVTLNTSSAVMDSVIGKRVIPFGSNGANLLATDVKQGGVSIYGKAVVETGWAYVVNQSNTGASLNKDSSSRTNTGQVLTGQPARLILLDDTLTGEITVEYASALWSNDSCHMNANSIELYGNFCTHFFMKAAK